MCLYPKLMLNKRYQKTAKNGGNIPPINDLRTLYVPVGCQECVECKKQKARAWQVRLLEDIKTNTNGKFVTLTFNTKSLKYIISQLPKNIKGYALDNAIAKYAVKHFRERYRKLYGKSIRHWLVTELGHKNTEHVHLHGIIWTNVDMETIEKIWSYGFMWKGQMKNGKLINYVNQTTVTYITKYVSKQDLTHPNYKSIILTSPGIGSNYTHNPQGDSKQNKFNAEKTNETYRTSTGHKIALPIYWRNKIYTEQEREQLWIHKLNKQIRWIRGEKYDVSNGDQHYIKSLRWHQKINRELKYGDGNINYDQKEYELQLRILNQQARITGLLKSKKYLEEKERLQAILKQL